ncbi:hypothetical protein KY284_030480 [Solanum tuberosum]|nr:hypothetical protein KY284_030480 [Solanum tuberosum]
MSYIPSFFHNEKVLPFKITDQPSLLVYLGVAERPPILRVYVDKNPIKEDHNLEEDQQDMLNDEFYAMDMNNHDDEIGKDEVPDFESNNPSTPVVGSNIPSSSQSSRVNNVRDDETGFYKGMTFKNKEELTNSLKIACLKKDFRLKKARPQETCQINSAQNWVVRYAVLNAYCYMLEVANPGSKTALSLDENGRFKYFFVSYSAWITGFQEMRKVIVVDGTFLRSKYNIMTSNITESVNAMFDVEREFHIDTLFDEINRRFVLLFHQRRMELVNSANRFVPSIEKDISKYVNAGNKLLAHQIANYKFSVTSYSDVATVDLQRRTCTCRIFYLDKIPCQHAMTALRSQYGADFENQIYEYSSPYYSVKKYIMAYCEEIHPVPPEDSWIVPLDIVEREIPPPYVDPSKPGRRRYKRRRGVSESFPIRKHKCSVCRDFGHRRTTCPNRNAP